MFARVVRNILSLKNCLFYSAIHSATHRGLCGNNNIFNNLGHGKLLPELSR